MVSDRQEMASVNDLFFPPEKTGEEEELSDDAVLANDEFPGKEFRLHRREAHGTRRHPGIGDRS